MFSQISMSIVWVLFGKKENRKDVRNVFLINFPFDATVECARGGLAK